MNTKNELIIGIVGFVIIIGMTVFYANQYKSNIQRLNTKKVANQNSIVKSASKVNLTTAEVAKHNTESDCWQIIGNGVYNVTSYLSSHPGGVSIMLPYCGSDATVAYNTKDGRGSSHSSGANQDLKSLKLGNLNDTINSVNIDAVKNSPGPRRRREYEDD